MSRQGTKDEPLIYLPPHLFQNLLSDFHRTKSLPKAGAFLQLSSFSTYRHLLINQGNTKYGLMFSSGIRAELPELFDFDTVVIVDNPKLVNDRVNVITVEDNVNDFDFR